MASHGGWFNENGSFLNWAYIVRKANPTKFGFDLHFVPPTPNSSITSSSEDVEEGRKKWKCGLVSVVLGSNPSF